MEKRTIHFKPTSFDQLPAKPGNPPRSAWGLWGEHDELGTLNLLTPERVLEASKLIRTGKFFPLNWDLELPSPPLFGRESIQHVIKNKRKIVNDDVYNNFNTQSSTQWDGLTHYGNNSHGCFYNGVKQEDVTGKPGTRNGIQAWAQHGIVGRGVLIDYQRWAERHGISYSPGETHKITVSELTSAAREQGVHFCTGDILIVRSGWIRYYLDLSTEARTALATAPQGVGVAQGEETLRFLWDNHFAAVAGDAFAFEVYPPTQMTEFMHETILGLWGMPIGEMFYLEKLAEDCHADGHYEFFFTSAPLNKLGGVASPPNALAIK